MTYAAVFPLVRARSIAEPFDYSVPEALRQRVGLGSLVTVPLGSRSVVGVVLGVSATTSHAGEVLPLSAALDLEPVPASLLALALRVRDHYLCSLGAALALVTPPSGAFHYRRTLKLTAAGQQAVATGRSELGEYEGGVVVRSGARLSSALERLRREGLVALEQQVHVVAGAESSVFVARGAGQARRAGVRQRAALALVETSGECEERELRRRTGLSRSGLQALLATGALVKVSDAVSVANGRQAAASSVGQAREEAVIAGPLLLAEQEAAVESITRAVGAGGEFLLHGVTGSGKTEVYLRAAQEVIAQGRSVIILVPEIALTGQTVARVRERFEPWGVAVMHSSLSLGQRLRAYADAASGRARIVVGARSAVFAPLQDLGLLVVDEEHDDSYKQGSEPRYDARTVARWRAEQAGAPLVLGSATPSVEAWARVRTHLELPRRVDGSQPPSLEVVDLRDRSEVLCPELRVALSEAVDAGHKAMLFLNRRGVASYVSCGHCGHTWVCPRCDVAYTLFRRGTELRCRVCGAREPAPHVCPVCGSVDVGRHGVGTEQLQEEVARLLPGVPLLRLDSDVASSLSRLEDVLERFSRPGPAVLVGTQMIAKGHHFPDVTVVGVVNADLALYFPDFRAEERTFAMLLQVGGRAGRGEHPGRVVVQTYNPSARAIVMAQRGKVSEFYEEEVERRRLLGYPPSRVLVAVEVSGPEADTVARGAATLTRAFRSRLQADEDVVGPGPLWRERGRLYCRSVVKTANPGETIPVVGGVVQRSNAATSRARLRVMVDVEPARV